MAKFVRSFAFGFLTQTVPGTINPLFDDVNGVGSIGSSGAGYPVNSWGTAEGLILGDASAGVAESGLEFALGRLSNEGSPLGSSFSRGLSDFLGYELNQFSVTIPFCGNRSTVGLLPTDIEVQPINALSALLEALGMTGVAAGGGPPGDIWNFSSTSRVASGLVYYNGTRVGIRDIRVADVSIELAPGGIPIATFGLRGTVAYDPEPDDISDGLTLDYGDQDDVSAPVVEGVGNTWGPVEGWSQMSLTVTNDLQEVGDSNQTPALSDEPAGRVSQFSATLYTQDSNKDYGAEQIRAAIVGDLNAIGWNIGAVGIANEPITRIDYDMTLPELQIDQAAVVGDKASFVATATARGSGTGNNELQFTFS